MQAIQRVLVSLRNYRWISLGALLSLLLLTVANAITPQLFRWGIDGGIIQQNLQIVLYSAAWMVVAAIARGLFNFGQSYWAEAASQGVAYDLRNKIFSKIQNLSFSYHDKAQTSQLLTRVTSDIEQIRTFIGTSLIQVIGAVVTLVTISVVLLIMNWRLALITLTVVPISGWLMARFISRNDRLFGQIQQQLGDLNAVLQENLVGIRVVKAFVRESAERSRYTGLNNALVTANMRTIDAIHNTFPFIFLLSNLVTLAVFGYGGAQVIGQRFSIGELVAFNSYLVLVLQPILLIGFAAPAIAQAAASAQRVYEVVDAAVEIRDRSDAIEFKTCGGRITFENVSFRYPGATTEALKDVSFETKPKELIAVLGMTGSGKSTVMNLIPRFYDVTKGAIRIDGRDVRDFTLKSLRAHIGIVFQETTLFSGTLRENIAYAKPNATLAEVIEAAKTAQIHDFIDGLPDGYETIVGERGIGLSGGQKQRIAIARTLLTDYSILILDDSTSAVDAKTAAQIQAELDNLMRRKACVTFVVAQRISTVKNADRILLIDKGKLVAQGTHEQLMQTSPLYGAILESQVKAKEKE
ncbi:MULTISPECIES: ABC transporter ATP-binding protein [unclassified Tolypothrix]|uniref:ABC transporter ATP-binding protein n=1 Tax=unclassified Tolypothrix TaxID=2649714 RepID=UPI0005EAB468|nr:MULTISPECIES: ABC transporter ATP-binding protein [unclassified Tolypothrix]EKE97471.1 ABC transporter, ATP-binding protein [Tolypothrix sp. PCC 7601]MBE9086406.1 ABC transporter ATP-binding protein [Tolypothrix sp. LEGE 11397]UYD28825.1 ABC transporter ATP-binding protein [Tolypothrix sp. PCC 7712]UYD37622.1 ABC transporter ATP-binding protein [Tolypothrix sp. PCC 7601]